MNSQAHREIREQLLEQAVQEPSGLKVAVERIVHELEGIYDVLALEAERREEQKHVAADYRGPGFGHRDKRGMKGPLGGVGT